MKKYFIIALIFISCHHKYVKEVVNDRMKGVNSFYDTTFVIDGDTCHAIIFYDSISHNQDTMFFSHIGLGASSSEPMATTELRYDSVVYLTGHRNKQHKNGLRHQPIYNSYEPATGTGSSIDIFLDTGIFATRTTTFEIQPMRFELMVDDSIGTVVRETDSGMLEVTDSLRAIKTLIKELKKCYHYQ